MASRNLQNVDQTPTLMLNANCSLKMVSSVLDYYNKTTKATLGTYICFKKNVRIIDIQYATLLLRCLTIDYLYINVRRWDIWHGNQDKIRTYTFTI